MADEKKRDNANTDSEVQIPDEQLEDASGGIEWINASWERNYRSKSGAYQEQEQTTKLTQDE